MFAKTADRARDDRGSTPAATASMDAALRAIYAMFERARWAVWRWHQAQQTEQQLSGLLDHMLKDMGPFEVGPHRCHDAPGRGKQLIPNAWFRDIRLKHFAPKTVCKP